MHQSYQPSIFTKPLLSTTKKYRNTPSKYLNPPSEETKALTTEEMEFEQNNARNHSNSSGKKISIRMANDFAEREKIF